MSYHATTIPVSRQAALQRSIRTAIRRTGTTIGLLGLPGIALAGPEGGDVVRGTADIINTDPNTTTINQLTDRAVINWQTFNVGADEFVIFNQLDSSSVVLNRVLSSDTSRIFGNISANGHVFLLNPHGIFFGEGSSLDVQGFLGSTLDIADDDFMSGNYNFTGAENAPALGTVTNAGTITAGEGGYVVLAGDFTENTGLISAQGGTAALVSGNALTLDLAGDGLISFAVDEATLADQAGVRNAGSIVADGGMVVMTARVANEVTSTVVNNEGTVRARAIENRGGEIWLVGRGGDVENSGTLDASGVNGDGGQMMVRSDRNITLRDGGVQTVDAAEGFRGGDARFIADEVLDVQAGNMILANGAIGGRVEVSGHGGLNVAGMVEIGAGGSYIIDPRHLVITSGGTLGSPTLYSNASSYNWISGLSGPTYVGASESLTQLTNGWISAQLQAGVNVALVAEESILTDASGVPGGGITINATGSANLTIGIGVVNTGEEDGGNEFTPGGGVFTGSNGSLTVSQSNPGEARQINLGDLAVNIGNGDLRVVTPGGGTISLATGATNGISAGNITIDAGTGGTAFIGGNTGGGSLTANNNIDITASTAQIGYISAAQNVTINGDVTGNNFAAGSSIDAAGIRSLTVNGNINVSNQVWLNASSGISVSGNVVATAGSIYMRTAPFSNSAGNITIGGQANAGLAINLNATGPATNGSGGNASVGSGMAASGDISITANAGGGSGGGNINVTGAITMASNVTLAANGIGSGGNVTVGGITAGGTIDIDAIGGLGGGVLTFNNDLSAGNRVLLLASGSGGGGEIVGTGNVSGSRFNLTATGLTGARGNITVSGSLSASTGAAILSGDGSTNAVSVGGIHAAGLITINNISQNGVITVGSGGITGASDLQFRGSVAQFTGPVNISGLALFVLGPGGVNSFGNVTAQTLSLSGSAASVTMGDIGGTNVSINLGTGANLQLGNVNVAGNIGLTGNDITIGNIDAGGNVGITGNNSTGTMSIGDIAGARIAIDGAGANIITGSLDASNATGLAEISLDATGISTTHGDITVNGNITITAGGVDTNTGIGAVLDLVTGTSGGNTVTVTGTTTLSATVTPFSNSDGTLDGSWGAALINASAGDGSVIMGDIDVTGAGEGRVEANAATTSLGDITLNIAGGDLNQTGITPENCSTGCSGSVTRTITDGGRGFVFINNDPFVNPGATASFGNVNITAPEAEFSTYGQVSVTGGSITLTATGGQYDRVSSGTYTSSGGGSWSLNETLIGAGARLNLETASSGSVTLGGDVAVSGQGYADVYISADTINVQAVSATASGGTFTRTGTPNPFATEDDGPFDGDGGGPRIDEGTINGGSALITLANLSSAATTVSAGNLSVNAMGSARIEILSQTVNAGDINGTATLSTRNGTINNTYSSGGSSFQESGSVSGSFGDVDIVIENGSAAGNITLGNVTLNGPVVGGHFGGANVTMGDFSFTGTGINLDVTETRTNLTAGTSETFTFQGEALITGMGISADNNVQVGDININGVGAAGTLISGVNVQTGNVTINVTDADIVTQDPNFFGGALTSFTVGNAVFGMDAGTATVNGNMNVTASGVAHIGGSFDVTGDMNIDVGRGYNPVISQQVQFLNAVRDDGGGSISLPGPMNVSADNLSIVSANALNLSNTVLAAGSNVSLEAGTNMTVTGISITAGGALTMTAGGNITNGMPPGVITADALAITAGGNINLPNITFNIGSGSIAGVTGDAILVSLLAGEGLAPSSTPNAYFAGNNVSLGNLNMTGDYLYIASNTLSLAGFSGAADDTLVQLTSLNPAASIGVEDQPANTSTVNYSNSDIFSFFAGHTLAIGSTSNTGDITIGQNGTLDIGSTNFFAVTTGSVTGLDKVLSTGVVKDLEGLLGGTFEVPQTDEIDATQNPSAYLDDEFGHDAGDDLSDDEEEGDEEGEDTDDDVVDEEEDDSLIKQDTVEEELMCES